ncbi:conserved hypothetical protein [Pediculus humanus corporis]|uniref:G-protein coupled receptors family 1 profile domain-containing protein n=1 Tax=Pediculus humanus subsp. corporis TaxID=121224 RepID=E0VE71_PEDHC|nr:uncharacterized protein Phum_PHUM128700 [Pediculus humanus corporis]EEB11677.1 conserved hypothetical protein [Pediculus humanus corporis]
MVVFIFFIFRELQILYKFSVLSQCLGDMIMAIFVGLNSINNFIQDTVAWNFGGFMCSWTPYVTTMSALLSSLILTCIAIDRYQGVVLLSKKFNPKYTEAFIIVACFWLVAGGKW